MILDALLQFSDTQTVTSSAVATNVLDLLQNRSIGIGEPMGMLFTVESAAVQSGGDEDYTFQVELASAAAQNANQKQIGQLVFESGTPDAPALNADLLVAGFQFVIPIAPINFSAAALAERYLGVRYVTAGAAADVDVSAHLVPLSMVQNAVVYPQSIVIS